MKLYATVVITLIVCVIKKKKFFNNHLVCHLIKENDCGNFLENKKNEKKVF